ncbi:hypothetical protein BOTBODRAFT_424708 [Botryobasidium botryosum FD-172 SS1]|uniref:Uncharacterized protein n=1 Tax=Botryobasidium botryosum (strain FD-172 SS1) TaxID=930990 RepID=A0A067M8K7_BOTB1|nr:hypothetical protein BOTBODRAFT_424708 [Botryobasidium botryosum FD-172 SS1]
MQPAVICIPKSVPGPNSCQLAFMPSPSSTRALELELQAPHLFSSHRRKHLRAPRPQHACSPLSVLMSATNTLDTSNNLVGAARLRASNIRPTPPSRHIKATVLAALRAPAHEHHTLPRTAFPSPRPLPA